MRSLASALFAAVVVGAACQPAEPTAAPAKEGPSSQPAANNEARDAAKHDESAEHGEHAAAKVDREQVDADGVVRRGAKLTDAAAVTVTDATAKAAELDGKTIKLTGTVASVCQPMGCWMVLADDKGQQVRISSKGHDIFVPKSSAGRVATVEGEFKQKVLSKEQAQHFEDERELRAGEVRKVFTEDSKEFSVNVVGLELKPAA